MAGFISVTVLLSCCVPMYCTGTSPDAVLVRVADAGAGLLCLVEMPGQHGMVFEEGIPRWRTDRGAVCHGLVDEVASHSFRVEIDGVTASGSAS